MFNKKNKNFNYKSIELNLMCVCFLRMILILFLLLFFGNADSENVYRHLRYNLFGEYFSFRNDLSRLLANREHLMSNYYDFRYNRYGVDRRPHSNISAAEFRDIYDNTWPVLITQLIETLPLFVSGKLEPDYLLQKHPKELVSVTYSRNGNFDSREALRISLAKFYDLISSLQSNSSNAWAYLADELFLSEHSSLSKLIPVISPYSSPNFFEDTFPLPFRSPSAFFLWGSSGSRSSMHVDPCNWTGISWLLKGRKRWRLVPPNDTPIELTAVHSLKGVFPLPCNQYSSPYDSFSTSQNIDSGKWKEFGFEVTQEAGEALIIPSGWYHQAFNEKESIAVSTSVMNEANWREILVELARAGAFSNIPDSLKLTDLKSFPAKQIVSSIIKELAPSALKQSNEAWQFLRAS